MAKVTRIHTDKTPTRRVHFIPEWAEKHGEQQADLVRRLDLDKGTVSRWFKGSVPYNHHLESLAEHWAIEPSDLFRHPDDDWLVKFFRDRDEAEKERIRATLEAAFPRRGAA